MNLEDTAPMAPVCVAETGSPVSETNPTRRPVSHRRKRSWWLLGRIRARRRERAELVDIIENSNVEENFVEVSLDDLLQVYDRHVIPTDELFRQWGLSPAEREVVDLPWPAVVPPKPDYLPGSMMHFAVQLLDSDVQAYFIDEELRLSFDQCEAVITTLVKFCAYCDTARTGQTMPNGQWRCEGCDILW